MNTPRNPPSANPETSTSTPEARKKRRLANPALHAAIRAMLKKHAPARERDDLFQDTLLAAWTSPHIPDEDEPFTKYACGIARRLAKKWVKKDAVRLEHHADSFDPGNDAHVGASPADLEARVVARAQLVALADKVKESEKRAYGWLLRNALGDSLYEIAGEEGLPYMNVYKATERLRERFANARRFFVFLFLLGTTSAVFRREISGDTLVGASPGGHSPVGLSPGLLAAYLVVAVAIFAVLAIAMRARLSRARVVAGAPSSRCH